MVVNVLDHVERCYTNEDGNVIRHLLLTAMQQKKHVVVSFAGVADVPSSFVNSAFIALLDNFTFDEIKSAVSVINSTRQINDMIRNRFRDVMLRRQHPTPLKKPSYIVAA